MVVQCDNLIYTPINALTFRITGNTECLKPVKKNGVIVALEGPNDLNITLGLTVPIKKTKYKINIIEQVRNSNSKLVYDISIEKRTKANNFVMTMLPATRK